MISVGSSDTDGLKRSDAIEKYDVLLFGPLAVTINEVVGDVVGVAQGNGVAFGIQALNIKTNAGIPEEYGQLITSTYDYKGKSAELSVASIPDFKLAAADISDGTELSSEKSEIRYDFMAARAVFPHSPSNIGWGSPCSISISPIRAKASVFLQPKRAIFEPFISPSSPAETNLN